MRRTQLRSRRHNLSAQNSAIASETAKHARRTSVSGVIRGVTGLLPFGKAVPDVAMQLPGAINLPLPDHDVLRGYRGGLLALGLNRERDLSCLVGNVIASANING